MTEKLYLQSDDLSAVTTVLSSTPVEGGQFQIRLSATLFHPQGGGQPYDIGHIGEVAVRGVFVQDDDIVHITDVPVACGECRIEIDAATRQLNTRMHSAGHLIAAAGEASGWNAIKGNHRPGEGRIVFETSIPDRARPEPQQLNHDVNRLVALDLPREQHIQEGIRRVTWGHLPLYACGGTHVTSTQRVGEIVIGNIKFRKGQLSVSYELAEQEPLTARQEF